MDAPLVPQAGNGAATGATWLEAFFNMLCFTVGAGMLGLPHALLFATSLYIWPVVFGGVLCFYTASLLHSAQLHAGADSYQALGEACGGKWLMRIVGATLTVNQIGIAVLYVITVCQNCEMLLGGNGEEPRWPLYPGVALVTFIACSRGESISHISGMSLVGLVSVLLVGFLVISAAASVEPKASTCSAESMPTILAGLGTAIFAFGGHPVYPDVQGSMQAPHQFAFVLTFAFVLMTCLFLLVMLSSWRTFGCGVHGYVLDDLSDSWLRQGAILGMTAHLMAAIPVVLLPMMRYVESSFAIHKKFQGVRAFVVVVVTLAAYMIPFFSDFLALLGGLTENLLVFFFPIAFHHLVFRREQGFVGLLVAAVHVLILLLAGAILVVGTAASLSNIASKWEQYHARWSFV